MKKQIILYILTVFSSIQLDAQINNDSTGASLQVLAFQIQTMDDISNRIKMDSVVTSALKNILEKPNSFQYTFDSLQSIRMLTAPDNSFKIFTWHLKLHNEHYVQRGFLQYKLANGTIQLMQLKDIADDIENPDQFMGKNNEWIGAVYYDIIQNEYEGKSIYALLGFDAYSNEITQKIIEILSFEKDKPQFGKAIFSYPSDPCFPQGPINRFIYSYKKGSNAFIRYDKDIRAIVLSELTSLEDDLNEKSTLVPTGDELYFKWKNGRWIMAQ